MDTKRVELALAILGFTDQQMATGTACKNIPTPLTVGNAVLIRTVTMIQVGKIEAITDHDVVLSGASWVASTGRFYNALKDGALDEVEPSPNGRVSVGRGAIVDVYDWTHALPTSHK